MRGEREREREREREKEPLMQPMMMITDHDHRPRPRKRVIQSLLSKSITRPVQLTPIKARLAVRLESVASDAYARNRIDRV